VISCRLDRLLGRENNSCLSIDAIRGKVRKLVVLASLLLPFCAAHAQQKGWQAAYDKADAPMEKCFADRNLRECDKMVRAYAATLASPDLVEAGDRRMVLNDYLKWTAAYGRMLRKDGALQQSSDVLAGAYRDLLAEYQRTGRPQSLIDNLALMSAFSETLIEGQLTEQAHQIAGQVGQIAAALPQLRNLRASSREAEALYFSLLSGSEAFENEQAVGYFALARKPGTHPTDARVYVIRGTDAADRAIAHLREGIASGWSVFGHERLELRLARLLAQSSDMRLRILDEKAEATQGYAAAQKIACPMVQRERASAGTAHRAFAAEDPLLQEICLRATLGYLEATGQLAEVQRQLAERQMTSQLDLLNVPLTPEQLRFIQDYKSPGK